MSVHDAEPGDIYADGQGKLWRIIGVYRDPSVTVEEVEGTLNDPNEPRHYAFNQAAAGIQNLAPPRASIVKARKTGGVSGAMWNGWCRIWRGDPP